MQAKLQSSPLTSGFATIRTHWSSLDKYSFFRLQSDRRVHIDGASPLQDDYFTSIGPTRCCEANNTPNWYRTRTWFYGTVLLKNEGHMASNTPSDRRHENDHWNVGQVSGYRRILSSYPKIPTHGSLAKVLGLAFKAALVHLRHWIKAWLQRLVLFLLSICNLINFSDATKGGQ